MIIAAPRSTAQPDGLSAGPLLKAPRFPFAAPDAYPFPRADAIGPPRSSATLLLDNAASRDHAFVLVAAPRRRASPAEGFTAEQEASSSVGTTTK